MDYTRQAKEVLKIAEKSAKEMAHPYVGTEHLLLASGRRRPVEVPGSEFVIDCDTVIMSLGTSPNPLISSTTKGLEINKRKCIVATEETGATSKEGVYAGGDAVTGAATVILAMGAGKAGAKGIHEYLSQK